jgi:ubiquitin thioesterase protein OTUB1
VLSNIVKDIGDNKITTSKQLQELFVDPNYRDAIVCYMRFLISGHIQLMADDYLPFVLGTTEHESVASYCKGELEGMYKEVDNIIVSAACASFDVCLRLECVDAQNRDLQQQVQTITFPDQGKPVIYMLYRPGHYDVLYKKT